MPSPASADPPRSEAHPDATGDLSGILAERVDNLSEAIRELDDAMARRKTLNHKFLKEIGEEMQEIHHQLGHLQPPWREGFQPQVEFLRLSLHKSLTSRRKDTRTEEHDYWKDVVDLSKERRKFLDEYKALLSTRKRLIE
jgi:hypothetical protein